MGSGNQSRSEHSDLSIEIKEIRRKKEENVVKESAERDRMYPRQRVEKKQRIRKEGHPRDSHE